MEISEQQLEDLIYNAYQSDMGDIELCKRGLLLDGYMLRQVDMGKFGIADLVTFNVSDFDQYVINVIELKKGKIDFSTLEQCFRYKIGVRTILEHAYGFDLEMIDQHVRITMTLIGAYCSEYLNFATEYLNEDTSIYTYKFDAFSGMSFEKKSSCGYTRQARFVCAKFPDGVISHMHNVANDIFQDMQINPLHLINK